MSLYITTSRKPSLLTRRLARWLAKLLGGVSENRGKRGIGEIVERAKDKGIEKIVVISEGHGNPKTLSLASEGKWLESILLESVSMPEASEKRLRLPREISGKALDASGAKVLKLLGVEETGEEESDLVAVASAGELSFEHKGKRVGPAFKILKVVQE